MNQSFVDKLSFGAADMGINLSEKQVEQFFQYYEILLEWNQVMNLTAITELDQVISKHFLDSLALVKAVDVAKLRGNLTLIDVGTGAGFPGIPLKIAFPQFAVTLLDSLNKRVNFLNEVISSLGLSDITAVHGRAEDCGRNPLYREQFDLCVSRAVANTATLSEYCLPFVKVGGSFIPYKSGTVDEELEAGKKAISILGGKMAKVVKFRLKEAEADRSLVIIEKKEKTAKRFPRKAGLPGKEPLG